MTIENIFYLVWTIIGIAIVVITLSFILHEIRDKIINNKRIKDIDKGKTWELITKDERKKILEERKNNGNL